MSFCILGQAGLMIAGPALISYGIDQGVGKGDVDVVTRAALLFIAAAAGAYVLGRAAILGVARIGEAFLRDVRERVFHHIMDLSMGFFDRTRTGLLVSRMTADVEALQDLVGQGLAVFLVSIALIVGTMVAMLLMSWQLALHHAGADADPARGHDLVPAGVESRVPARARPRRRHAHRVAGGPRGRARHPGVRPDRPHRVATSPAPAASSTAPASAPSASPRSTWRSSSSCRASRSRSIIGLGAYFASEGDVTVGVVTAFVLYLNNLFEPIQQLTQVFNSFQQAAAALKKLYGLLDEQLDLVEPEQPVELPAAGDLVVDNVSFRYAPQLEPVLHDVSLTLEHGKRLVLVGPTGAGKSTLAKLMARFYDPTDGAISFGGVDLRNVDEATLRRRIVVIPQEGFLFTGTIRDNLLMAAPDADDARIRAALDDLGLAERFDNFLKGLDTQVDDAWDELLRG